MRPELIENPVFLRYYEKWQKEPASVVFAAISEIFRTYNMLDEAIQVATEGLKHHPNLVSGHLALAKAFLAKGEMSRAKDEAFAILGLMPNNIEALAVLELAGEGGQGTVDGGRWTGNKAEASHPRESGDPMCSLYSRCSLPPNVLIGGGNDKESDEEDITEDMPLAEFKEDETDTAFVSDHEAWHTVTMAKMLMQQGHVTRAKEIFRKILDREPGNEAVKAELNKLE